MAAIVGIVTIVSRGGLKIEVHHRKQTNKSKLALHCINHYFTVTIT